MISDAEWEALLTPRSSPYWTHAPTAPQAAFLLLDCREALYGGAAGGGKSDALLMAALQYVDVPNYAAILFRKSYADLSRPGALMDRARDWLSNSDAVWNEVKKTWRFPSGATLSFGYLEDPKDVYAYQGAEFQFCGFDELTQLPENAYLYMFSRLRRLQGSTVPLRVRAASNPGGVGHGWVRNRFLVEGPTAGRIFIPAKLEDNPHLDHREYEQSLSELDPVTRAQLRAGDWSVRDKDNSLVPEWTDAVALACTQDRRRPAFFTPYVVGDLGSRDLTVWLFAYWDFENAQLVVEDEVVLKDPSTSQLIAAVAAKAAELWPALPEPPRCLSDVDWRLVKDFAEAGIRLTPTKKNDALGHRGKARAMIDRRQVIVSSKCRVLLLTLESAVWNSNRTDYARTESTGHADAWDALVYLIRNVDVNRNPKPPDAHWVDAMGARHLTDVTRAIPRSNDGASLAIARAFGHKPKPQDIWLPGRRRRT